MLKERISAKASFSQNLFTGYKRVWRYLFLFLVFILMSLPLFTTFSEILTKIVEKTEVYQVLGKYIVPFEIRAVSVLVKPLGIESLPTASHLLIRKANGSVTSIFFSWNCLGWQSLILLILTFIVGLGGNHSVLSKIESIILGLSGTFLINLVRISLVAVVGYFFGQLSATLVHDSLGTMFTMVWFFFFWYFSYSFILSVQGES